MSGTVRIGLPRAMLYHKYHVMWSSFFEGIGCGIAVSPPSNVRLLERGAALSVDETCLSMKLFLGHVEALRGRSDCVLVPNLVSPRRGEEACVKLMGAFDIARHALPEIAFVSYTVDEDRGVREERELVRLGQELGASRRRARAAYREARHALETHWHEAAREQLALLEQPHDDLRVLLVGHAYNVADEIIGGPVRRLLASLGATVIDAEALGHVAPSDLHARISVDVNWTFNKELLNALELARDRVDGVVFLVAFPCGPDALMVELCQRRLGGLPSIALVLDELTGLTGLQTRIESFVDILALRRGRGGIADAQGSCEGVRADVPA
ncbi:MAG: acyl-CoA dehydratase activase-related protein [Anaerosomatales bacterium]|nr:acyl-CoA dehydratase activase-related protein [Anaerosomatales bacterium]